MKQRIKPTHFIEVWNNHGKTCLGGFNIIDILKHSLDYTDSLNNCHTIAIFKIKFKK